MTGAGFGGCAVALVEKARVDGFVGRVAEDYGARTGLEPAVHVTGASAGARVVTGTAGETGPAGA
jgi:galactokinase